MPIYIKRGAYVWVLKAFMISTNSSYFSLLPLTVSLTDLRYAKASSIVDSFCDPSLIQSQAVLDHPQAIKKGKKNKYVTHNAFLTRCTKTIRSTN